MEIAKSHPELKPDLSLELYDYVHNGLILPDLLLHLQILKRYPRCSQLTSELESFLEIVTLRMTPAEHKRLMNDAKASRLSVSAYLKACWQKTRAEK